jgi:predicted  nucleic acid-binding Zn-ribbon protein
VKDIDCEQDASGNKTNMFQFDKEYNNIFLYGKEVNDFHTIDKNQIFALHHSAIQELSRRGDTLSKQLSETTTSNIDKYTILSDKLDTLEVKNSILVGKNKSLKDEMATIRSDNINLKQRMVDMEAKINDILSKL